MISTHAVDGLQAVGPLCTTETDQDTFSEQLYSSKYLSVYSVHIPKTHQACAPGMCARHVHKACAPGMCARHVHKARAPRMWARHVHKACGPGMCTRHVGQACDLKVVGNVLRTPGLSRLILGVDGIIGC